MKKTLLIIITVLTVSLAYAQDFTTQDNRHTFYWRIEGDRTFTLLHANKAGASSYGHLVIPASVIYNGVTYRPRKIGAGAFLHQYDLRSVTLPPTIEHIDNHAFDNTRGLTSINLENVKHIGYAAFNTSGIKEINMENAQKIEDFAFQYCNNLVNVQIKFTGGDRILGRYAFRYCDNLTLVEIRGTQINVQEYAFYWCTHIKSVKIDFTTFPWATFEDCQNIPSIVIPEGTSRIEARVFWSNYALNTITLPSTLTYIGQHAFARCVGLNHVISFAQTPPRVESETFRMGLGINDGINISNAGRTLHVPPGSRQRYKQDGTWGQFNKIEEMGITLRETGNLNMPLGKKSVMHVTATVPANQDVIWSSSDISVATVSPIGVVQAVGRGRATITASFAACPSISFSLQIKAGL